MPWCAPAQVQQAWAMHYNNGILNGTNQAVKVALDNAGNIYVTGFSQNTNTNLGYVTIKYAPNGNQLWVARYDSTNYAAAMPSGLVLDDTNNVLVTGSALTVKYDPSGSQLWTAPYAGSAVAIDSGGNAIVTGFAAGFNTVKISPNGSNLWSTSYIEPNGPVVSQAVVVDSGGNAYVAGSDTYVCYSYGTNLVCRDGLLVVKYDQNGNQLWKNVAAMASYFAVQVAGLAVDSLANVYVLVNGYQEPYSTYSYASDGSELWAVSNPTTYAASSAHALAVDKLGDTIVTGQLTILFPTSPLPIGTFAINNTGNYIWTNLYFSTSAASVGMAIAVDSGNNCYVTGYSCLGTNSGNDIVTIKYDQNGNQIWLQRYSSPGKGNAAGNAIAVDKNGNVYVTGYETLPGGGTGIVTIKYFPVVLQRRSDGTVILQAKGSPGESFDIQASADLLNWLDLGSVLADTNGLMQFDDTNAPNYPARFYYTSPQ